MLNFLKFEKKEQPQLPEKQPQKNNYQRRKYKAYLAGESTNQTFSWTAYKHTSDEIIEKYYEKLVARSCEQCFNNPYARKFLLMLQNNVIGPQGIKLISQAKDSNNKLDKVANDAIEKTWVDWGENCDVTGKLDWLQLQKLIISTIAREGEVLIRIVKGKNANPFGFALQLIDARRLDINKREISTNGENFIKFGIEFNPYGRPLNYYILQEDANSYYSTVSTHQIIPANEILHIFAPEYIEQKRGLPWFSTVLMRMNMLSGFEDSAVANARAGACKMGFIEDANPDSYDDDDEEREEIEIDAGPLGFVQLPPGLTMKPFNPDYPNNEFDSFSKAILRGISAGIGVSYNGLANDLTSVNFSSLRQGALDERDSWMCIQQWLISAVHIPIYTEWLKYSLLANKIKVNGNKSLPPEKIDKYKNFSWQPRRWSWVDPVKDVNSAISSVNSGFRSRGDVIREQGRDPEEVWSEIERENEILRGKNILVKDETIKDVADGTDQ